MKTEEQQRDLEEERRIDEAREVTPRGQND